MFKKYDWWMFSKLDQSLDDVYIPYYNPKENRITPFRPDFIFWMQKGKKYQIVFVDPKGTEHTDGIRKIDDFKHVFERKETGLPMLFDHDGLKIQTRVFLKPARGGIAAVPQEYRKYWFDNFPDLEEKLAL